MRNIAQGRNEDLPSLCWKSSRLRRVAVKWYHGWFLFQVERIIARYGPKAQQVIEPFRELMLKPTWTKKENKKAKRVIEKCIYNSR